MTSGTEPTATLEFIKLIKFMQHSPCLGSVRAVQKADTSLALGSATLRARGAWKGEAEMWFRGGKKPALFMSTVLGRQQLLVSVFPDGKSNRLGLDMVAGGNPLLEQTFHSLIKHLRREHSCVQPRCSPAGK